MEVQTIKDFTKAQGFVQLAPTIRVNTNGYPFITFIKEDNVAENIYFSKNAATIVKSGDAVTKQLLASLQIAAVTNADNEIRVKLISNSDRIELSSLLD